MNARDPRIYQIATLAMLLAYGLLQLDFDIRVGAVIAILATVLVAQWAASTVTARCRFDPRSALISGLSLCLLLRTNVIALAMLAAVVAIVSKFALRVHGKHVFNPTNFAIVSMMLVSNDVWVSPGQWGSGVVFAFLLASVGMLVVTRAARADVTLAFLVIHVALNVGRALRLGEPLSIPLHRFESGALVLFAFFMISDPRTTPNSRAGRFLFAALVAGGAYVVQFTLFRPNALLWSLVVCSVAVPLIDRLLPGTRYEWRPAQQPLRPAVVEGG